MTTPPFWGRTMTGLAPAGALPLQAARSVANYRKQESLDSEVIDFPIHDFRILPRKGNFATEPLTTHAMASVDTW